MYDVKFSLALLAGRDVHAPLWPCSFHSLLFRDLWPDERIVALDGLV